MPTREHPSPISAAVRLFGLSALFVGASALSAVLAAGLGLWLRGRTPLLMDDLIDVTNPAYPKQIDLWVIAAWALMTTALALLGLAIPAVRRRAEGLGGWCAARPTWFVWLAVVFAPILPWLTNLADFFPTLHLWGSISTLAFVGLGITAYAVGKRRSVRPAVTLTVFLLIASAVVGGWTLVSLALARLVPDMTWRWWVPAAILAAVSFGALLWSSGSLTRLTRTALLAQVYSPMLLFVLVAPLGTSNAAWLVPAVMVLVLVLMALAVRRAWRQWAEARWDTSVSPVTIGVLAAYVAGLLRLPSGGVPTDEYHWGELLVQWDQVFTYGRAPFDDYIPAPGLNGLVYGAVNQVLGGDSITFQRAVQVTIALLAAVIAGLVVRTMGKKVGLLLVPAAAALAGGGVADRFALVAVSALILALPGLWARPLTWLGVWLLLIPANLLFIPSSGTAFLLATAPVALVQGVRWARAWRQAVALDYAALVLGVVVLGLTASTLLDLLAFVRTQGAANDVAWGLPLLPWQSTMESIYIAALAVVRMAGWWLGVPVAAALILVGWRRRRDMVLLAGATILLAAALTPYVFGRIERSGISRVGLASILILGLLIPLATRGVRARFSGDFGAVLVRTSAIVVLTVVGVPPAVLTQGLAPFRPMAGVTVDGGVIGLPNLGVGPAAQADSLRLRSEAAAAVADGDVVVDLANRQAYYFFAGLPQPTTVGAYWNMVSQQEQEAVIADFARSKPAIVWPDTVNPAEPGFWEPMMRAYRVSRWLWENGYRAYDFAGQTVLLSSDAAARADDRFRELTPQEVDDRLVGAYPRLGEMFATWGANWTRLAPRFESVPSTISVADSAVTFDIESGGVRPDAVLVELTCDPAPAGPATFTWGLADGSEYSRAVPMEPGVSLVPVGAYPSWQGGPELTLTAPAGCSIHELTAPELLRLAR